METTTTNPPQYIQTENFLQYQRQYELDKFDELWDAVLETPSILHHPRFPINRMLRADDLHQLKLSLSGKHGSNPRLIQLLGDYVISDHSAINTIFKLMKSYGYHPSPSCELSAIFHPSRKKGNTINLLQTWFHAGVYNPILRDMYLLPDVVAIRDWTLFDYFITIIDFNYYLTPEDKPDPWNITQAGLTFMRCYEEVRTGEDFEHVYAAIPSRYCDHLYMYVIEERFEAAERLLQTGIDINASNGYLLTWMCQWFNFDQIEFLVKHGADMYINDYRIIVECIDTDRHYMLTHLFRCGMSLDRLMNDLDVICKSLRRFKLIGAIHEDLDPFGEDTKTIVSGILHKCYTDSLDPFK